MVNKKLSILFLASVILAFLFGYYASRLLPFLPSGTGGDMFEEITESFKNYYYYDLEDEEITAAFIAQMEAIINAYAIQNNDPYTRLVATPIGSQPGDDEKFVGIGINYMMEDNNIRVYDVIFGGPSYGKLYPNDLIVGIIKTETIWFEDLINENAVFSQLSGVIEDTVTLLVQDPDDNIEEVNIQFAEILTPTASTFDLEEDDLAYIKLNRFAAYIENVTPGTNKVFADLLFELEQTILNINPENKTLIIDLRDNPGGSLSALHNQGVQGMLPGIVQQLLERSAESAVFTMIPKTGKVQSFVGGVTGKDYQIVVLVNEESASAAEVLAASLKYYGGYEVYGIPTYGKGVYQNSIHLRDIQGVRYSLTYTEGEWFYDQGKNVAVDPIEVIEIIQSGIKMLDLPVYQGEVNYNSVSLSLVEYQHFLNYYYGLEGVSAIRTDGYLDTETRDLIAQFQSDEFLPITEKLDLLTARRIHEIFKTDHQNIDLDHQLQTLIAILKGDE